MAFHGEVTARFEDEFKKMHKARHAFAVSNCSVGLYLANVVLGIKSGDEVICPRLLLWLPSIRAACRSNAVYADITSSNNLNISPADIERKITPGPRLLSLSIMRVTLAI